MSDKPTTSYYNAPPPQGEPLTPDAIPVPNKKMSKGRKWAIGLGAFFAIGLIGSLTGGGKTPTADTITTVADSSVRSGAGNFPTTDPSVQASLDKAAADKAAADAQAVAAEKAAADKAAADKAAADKAAADKAAADKAAAEQAAADAMTAGQTQALAKAQDYLEMSAFSHSGLIEQLQYEQFSKADATFAADHVTVDWNEQAARKAKSYLEMTAFSRGGLIDQLRYEGFTRDQAAHGASAAGL